MSIPRFSPIRSAAIRHQLVAAVDQARPTRRPGWLMLTAVAVAGALVGGAVRGAALAASPRSVLPSPVAGDGTDGAGIPAPEGIYPGQPIISLLPGGLSFVTDTDIDVPVDPLPVGTTHIRLVITCLTQGGLNYGFTEDVGRVGWTGNTCWANDVGTVGATVWFDFPVTAERTLRIRPTDGGSWAVSVQYVNTVETAWGVNQRGETYGVAKATGAPDLMLVMGSDPNGGEILGYARSADLDGPMPTSPADGAEHNGDRRDVPLYQSDGLTVIGTFTIG